MEGVALGQEQETVEGFILGAVELWQEIEALGADVRIDVQIDLFLDALEAELGVDAPRVDAAEVLATDPYSPANMAAAGVEGCAKGWR